VRFDVQSAVLERPSADGILRMLTHMSLTRDPRAPVHVPDDVSAALPPDPSIVALEQQRQQLKAGVYRIQGTDVEAEVRRLTTAIGAARSRRRNIVSEEYRDEYFRNRPTEDIERQNRGEEEEEYIEPVIEHQIPERAQLANLICTRFADLKPQDAVQLRIRAAKLMLSLCGLCRCLGGTDSWSPFLHSLSSRRSRLTSNLPLLCSPLSVARLSASSALGRG
jgi:Protein of unknown function (DUF3435)